MQFINIEIILKWLSRNILYHIRVVLVLKLCSAVSFVEILDDMVSGLHY